jgi:hypothetical protein
MAWDPITQPCDYIILAGQKSPGYADVYGAYDEREFKVNQPPFSTGAVIVYKRRKLAEFSVRIRLYTLEEHAAFTAWRPVIDAKPGVRTRATALDIQHPLLAQLDIKQVVVKSVSQLDQTQDGEWSLSIAFLESRPLPRPSLAKVEAAKASPGDPVDQKLDENKDEIQRIVKELAK